jgi:hypothetical protein
MRFAVLLLAFTSLCFAAEKPKSSPTTPTAQQQSQAPRYESVPGDDGAIIFVIDHKDNTIDYKEDPKKIVEFLLRRISQIGNVCAKKIEELEKTQKNKKQIKE